MRILLIMMMITPVVSYGQLEGRVVKVADGDTFTMLINNKQVRVRLHGIDCPESSQDFGQVAKKFLSDYVFGKTVTVKEMDIDRYGRIIGMVTIEGVNVNEKILEVGLAWHYVAYDKNIVWHSMELKARQAKIGLWAMPNPTPPWEFRKKIRL